VIYNHADGGEYVLGKHEFSRVVPPCSSHRTRKPWRSAASSGCVSTPGTSASACTCGACTATRGVPEHWQLVRSTSGHFETRAMRRRVVEFLDRFLVSGVH
jgi:hypothetical protein